MALLICMDIKKHKNIVYFVLARSFFTKKLKEAEIGHKTNMWTYILHAI